VCALCPDPEKECAIEQRQALCETSVEEILWIDCIAGWTCFTMTGIGHVIELNAADIFPLLRLSNQGCILVALVCGKEVTVVEYDFCRHDLLNVSAGACQIFCVKRGHEIIPKGKFHDRRNDHQKAQEAESAVPVPG
jgi:hypothetical protein